MRACRGRAAGCLQTSDAPKVYIDRSRCPDSVGSAGLDFDRPAARFRARGGLAGVLDRRGLGGLEVRPRGRAASGRRAGGSEGRALGRATASSWCWCCGRLGGRHAARLLHAQPGLRSPRPVIGLLFGFVRGMVLVGLFVIGVELLRLNDEAMVGRSKLIPYGETRRRMAAGHGRRARRTLGKLERITGVKSQSPQVSPEVVTCAESSEWSAPARSISASTTR